MTEQSAFSSARGAAGSLLADPRLRPYLNAPLLLSIQQQDASPRLILEVLAQLASVRYTIGTYLPRRLLMRRISTHDAGPWLEWLDGSLLYADISGSTALAERLSALGREGIEIVTAALNEFFATMLQIIQRAGGDLLTFGGDALLVLFSGTDHALIATRAALDLLAQLSDFSWTVPGIGMLSLGMHIGVESGPVALASAGAPDALRYSAFGSTVNRVAHAEASGRRSELVVGPGTWPLIAGSSDATALAAGYWKVAALAAATEPADNPVETLPNGSPEELVPLLLQQLERISPYLPADLLARIVADPQRPALEADLRPVTVLFAQVTGLGPLIETLEPPMAARLLDAVLQPMQAAVQQYGGFVNKLDLAEEGDKLLAIFGAPIACEDHAERAARAALAMFEARDFIRRAVADILGTAEPPLLNARIGINTGSVFAGNVGTATRKEYTVMGDAVNVAARVMAASSWNEIWCSEASRQAIAGRLTVRDCGQLAVKGKQAPLQLFQLLGITSDSVADAGISRPLIGRTAERALLHRRLEQLRNGHGCILRIMGDAGVGKSRLTAALLDDLHAAGYQSFVVNCLSYETNTPFAPWSEWLKRFCGIATGDPQPRRAAYLRAALRELSPDAEDWLPLLAGLVRLDSADTVLTRALDPQQRQERRAELIADLLCSAARRAGGMVLIFEDLHWADQASLDLWCYIAGCIAHVPVLLLGVHRPDLRWGSSNQEDGAFVLHLSELSLEESHRLLEASPAAGELSPRLREQIVARAAGNPLYLEEMLRAMQSGGKRTLGTGALNQLPDSLHGLLLARIDRLTEPERSLLRVAAVIGHRFPADILRSLSAEDVRTLLRSLAHLDNESLTVLEREVPEQVRSFRHAMIQEVAYESLLYARRRELHRRIGEYIEWRYHDELAALQAYYGRSSPGASPIQDGRSSLDPVKPIQSSNTPLFLAAHHYRLSDRPDQAITYLLLAGHVSREAYANDAAIQYYQQVVQLLAHDTDDARRWEAREALGDVLCTLGDYDAALAEYAAILAEHSAEHRLPPTVLIEARRSRGYALEKQGQYSSALAELDQAGQLIQAHLSSIPPLLVSAVYADMASVLFRRGELERALEVCSEGLTRLRRDRRSREDERIEARLHTQMGTIYGVRGDYAQARFHFENALAAHEAIDNLYGSSIIHNNLGYLWQLQDQYDQALEHYRLVEELARRINHKYVLSSAYLNSAYATYFLGRYEEADAGCRAALHLCEEMGDQAGIASAHDTMGQVARNRGDYGRALEHYRQALAIEELSGNMAQQSNTLNNIALAYNAMAEPDRALPAVEQALQIAEQIQAAKLQAEALNTLAETGLLLHEAGAGIDIVPRSIERARQALALADELGSRGDRAAALRVLGLAAAVCGEDFADYFQTSIEIYAEIKDRFEMARSTAALSLALAAHNQAGAAAYLEQAGDLFRSIGAQGELKRLDLLD
jgi:adenylate cyclase